MSVIEPAVGRIVWFRPSKFDYDNMAFNDKTTPMAADVVYVWNSRMVNLSVKDHAGNIHRVTSVTLVQAGDTIPGPESRYCEWMPYQKGQAAKAEALEKEKGL